MACALTDVLRDGLSMVYSFFHPGEDARSLGTYMILDHIAAAQRARPALCLSGLLDPGQRQDGLQIALPPARSAHQDGWSRLEK